MTILWDLNPTASQVYQFALGGEVEQHNISSRVSRALEEDSRHTLVVIGPEIPLEAACELAEKERVDRPELGVILMRHRLEVAALALALRSGVREVIQADDLPALSDAVRRSEALTLKISGQKMNGSAREGRVITVFSAKGGVGKTTIATNLGTYLASTGSSTLLLDLDLMFGDVAISLQLMPMSSVRDVVAMTGHMDIQGIRSVVTKHEGSGLDVIAAPSDPGEADRVPASIVSELLRVARGAYDYVLVDTPPAFTEHVLTAIDVSDLTVLIATLDIPAIKNLRIAMNTLDTLGISQESRLILLNRADAKVGLQASDVESALNQHISASVPNSLSVSSSVNRGVAIILDDPRSPVSSAIREFADLQIRERFGEIVMRSGRRLGLGRLKR